MKEELVPSGNFCLTPRVSPELITLILPAVATLGLTVCVGPLRRAAVNGWRCLVRHPVLWKIPTFFAAGYTIFQMGIDLVLRWRSDVPLPAWWIPPTASFLELATEERPYAWFPAAEAMAGTLNCLVATFPISAIFALLFLLNGRRVTSELRQVLCRRFGWRGWIYYAGLLVCAISALVKPLAFVFLPDLGNLVSLRLLILVGTTVNALSFVFEYLLGTLLQVFLLLTAYGWVRGRRFTSRRLLPFAVRRLGWILPWALVLVAATLLFIHLPLLVETLITGAPPHRPFDLLARPVLLAAMLLLPTVPIYLTLHNHSLRRAVVENFRFLRRQGILCFLFLLVAFLLQFMLHCAEATGQAWLGDSFPALAWSTATTLLSAAAGGWILAAWVCFYTSLDGRSRNVAF